MQEQAVNLIREELEKRGIKVVKIVLFGSRARGDYKEDSDWDFFVVVDKEMKRRERQKILTELYRKLAKIEDSYEIILKSEASFKKMKNYVGCVSYDTDKEGVTVWKS